MTPRRSYQIRVAFGAAAGLGLVGMIGYLMIAGPRTATPGDQAVSQPDQAAGTETALPLVANISGHGDVAAGASRSDRSAPVASSTGPETGKTETSARNNQNAADPYLKYQNDLVKQELAEKLQEQAQAERARQTALDAPLPPGRYRPVSLAAAAAASEPVAAGAPVAASGPANSASIDAGAGRRPSSSTARHAKVGGGPTSSGAYPAAAASGQAIGSPAWPVASTGIGPQSASRPADAGYLASVPRPARSPNEIWQGSVIPAVLITGINSNLPGSVTAQVSRDVYDSETGGTVLIPAGSRLFGRYDANIRYGQDRAVVFWSRLIFPDGATLDLQDQLGTDRAGQSGFHDRRQGNFWRILGANLLFSVLGAGQQALEAKIQSDIGGGAAANSALGTLISGAQGYGTGSAAASAAGLFNGQNASVQPTLIIRPGYRFEVMVAKTITLTPWRTR